MKLYSPADIAIIRDKYNFRFNKNFGQNFLTDKNIIDEIIGACNIQKDDLVIEIGPGIGVLTNEAAGLAARVVAVEIDKYLIPILKNTLSEYNNVRIINADILKTDLAKIIEEEKNNFSGKVIVLGNLPYYILSAIIMHILESGIDTDGIVVMMPDAVAARMNAAPGGKEYGKLSVAVQYRCNVTKICDVPKSVFIPRPEVDSTVLKLQIIKDSPNRAKDDKIFFQCVGSAFGQRRKSLLNSLTGVCGLTKQETAQVLEQSGIDSGRRAETLTIEEFVRLADTVEEMVNG